MRIRDMRVNHLCEPLGYQLSPLSFSWKCTEIEGAKKQEWARIRIYHGEKLIYDSGEDSAADSLDTSVDLALEPRTRYRWTVEVLADNGECACGESFFETGKMQENWNGRWISPKASKETPGILRKVFSAEAAEQARLYICGLGVYEVYLNGEKVGQEYLAPGYHSYDFHAQVSTYAVDGLLKDGENELQIWLGDGWFRGRLGFDGGYTDLYGDRTYAIAELYAGNTCILATDETWQCGKSPVIFSNIYDGEVFDARMLKGIAMSDAAENSSDADASEKQNDVWESAEAAIPDRLGECRENLNNLTAEARSYAALCDRMNLPIVKKESFPIQEVLHTPKKETVLDFGQELTGWVEFECSLPAGMQIRLTGSEIMQNDCFYNENYRTAKTEFTYISDGEKRHVRPHFTFYCFRYIKAELLDAEGNEVPFTDIDAFGFIAWHLRSDFDAIGSIETGNAKVDRLFANAMWGQKDNFLDVPTDCPQRDERLGWTGDAQVFSETACYNMFMPAFYRKYLWDMRAEQSILGGSVPNVVPRLKQGMVAEHGSCPWGDAGVVIPWNVYLHYGSRTLLAECYEGMKGWVDNQRRRDESVEGPHLIKDGFHFADWLALDNPMPGPFGATDPLYIASAYYYRCTSAVADAAAILGYEADAAEYRKLAGEIKLAIQDTYFDENGLCKCETQTGSSIAIMYGLNKDEAARKAEGEKLSERVTANNNHLNTGFVGTTILCPALTETGSGSQAVDLLLNEDYPGWLYSVNLGATTIWERWNSVESDGTINAEGMNSLNHYSYGSIEAWMYGYTAGIRPLEPGFRKARIEPHADERLGHVNCSLQTAAGLYRSSWKYEDGRCSYEIEVPFNAEAELVLDGKSMTLTAGVYRF
ncbi:MAG: family 78 glycoside hydrolase catalytic domain [Eubacteriales bacterium]|nr:family 78 glycoside hydrolase catalytic domain [Eubacteriales bacterium]